MIPRISLTALTLSLAAGLVAAGEPEKRVPRPRVENPKSPLDFIVAANSGKEIDLRRRYANRVCLFVNVASACGLTDAQYTSLVKLHARFGKKGLAILAFPANDFGRQEPGSDKQIREFCTGRGVEFDLFAKITVKGEKKHPVYRFLTEKRTNPKFAGEIRWNFQKFLTDYRGQVIARFDPREDPMGEKVLGAIEKALAERERALAAQKAPAEASS